MALGTTVVLRLARPPAPQARTAVQRELDLIDAAASRFRADSELSRLNRAGGRPDGRIANLPGGAPAGGARSHRVRRGGGPDLGQT